MKQVESQNREGRGAKRIRYSPFPLALHLIGAIFSVQSRMRLALSATSQKVGIIHLPDKALLTIFSLLSSEDLLILAATCRRLNEMSLSVYFAHHRPPTAVCDDNISTLLPILRGIRISLFIRPLELLSVALHSDNTLLSIRTRQLTMILFNLNHVREVEIKLLGPPRVTETSDWQRCFRGLLEAAMHRCHKLTIAGDNILQSGWKPTTPLPHPKSSHSLPRRLSALIRRRSDPGQNHEEHHSTSGRIRRLSELNIHSSMLLRPPFLDWTLHVTKVFPLTALSLELEGIFPDEWRPLLRILDMPHLRCLSIASQNIHLTDVWDLTARHPSIIHLRLRLPLESANSQQIPRLCLPNLETLDIHRHLAMRCITSKNPLPQIRRIALAAHFDNGSNMHELEQALSCISRRPKPVELKIELWGPDVQGCTTVQGPALPCVTRLHLQVLSIPDRKHLLESLPNWLAYSFPELQVLLLHLPSQVNDPTRTVCLRTIRDALAWAEIVEMKDDPCIWPGTLI